MAVTVAHYIQSMLDEGRLARGEQPAVPTGQDAWWRDNKNRSVPACRLALSIVSTDINIAAHIYSFLSTDHWELTASFKC
jgi:hypothetical protein